MREKILNELMQNLPKEYDTSEGSFAYDILASSSFGFENLYKSLQGIFESAFVSTAKGYELDKKCSEQGIFRKPAIKSSGNVEVKGTEGAIIQKGALCSSDTVNFEFTENIIIPASGKIVAMVKCLNSGASGNVPSGAIKTFPVTIAGIHEVTNISAFSNGVEIESDESLRSRFLDKVRKPATSGNVSHYEQWAKSIAGVGAVKVFPLYGGAGTVKVVICSSASTPVSDDILKETSQYIETQRPIGADVLVENAVVKNIEIRVKLTFKPGADTERAKKEITLNIKEFLKNIAFKRSFVSYPKIGSIIFDNENIEDYSNLQINGGSDNILLNDTEVAVLSEAKYD